MADPTLPKVLAGLCCLVMWAPVAALAGFGAHRRMISVERADGTVAAPAHETPLLLYAAASIAWPFALVLSVVGLGYRKWARVGRGSTLVLLGHFTVAVLGSIALVVTESSERGVEPVGIVVYACAMVAFGALLFAALTWRWAGARAERVAAGPPSGDALGLARFAIYAVAALVPIAGMLAPFLLPEPQHAHVGKVSARVSMLALVALTLGVCVGVVVLVSVLEQRRLG